MTEITSELSRKIANVGFVCACLVVSIHIVHPVNGAGKYVDMLLAGGISKVAVPMFFAISGFLLAGKMVCDGWWKREVCKRLRTLVVPFYCWSLISFCVATLESFVAAVTHGSSLSEAIGGLWRDGIPWSALLGFDLTVMPFVGALWYVRCLFFFVLLSPLVLKFVRRGGFVFVGILYALYLTLSIFVMPSFSDSLRGFFSYGLSLHGIVWFSLGVQLRLTKVPSVSFVMAVACWVLGAVLWGIVRMPIPAMLANTIGTLTVPVLACALWASIPASRWPVLLTTSSFPIFLMHLIFIGLLQMVPSHIPGTESLFGIFVHWLVPIGASILVALLLRHVVPSISTFLFGGR